VRILEIERGSTKLLLWTRLRTCRKTENGIVMVVVVIVHKYRTLCKA